MQGKRVARGWRVRAMQLDGQAWPVRTVAGTHLHASRTAVGVPLFALASAAPIAGTQEPAHHETRSDRHMRGMKFARFAALAVLALVALPVGSAYAAAPKPKLQIEKGGTPLAPSSTVYVGLAVDECVVYYEATLINNGAKKDVAKGSTQTYDECEVGKTATATFKEIALEASHKAKLSASITITEAGCTYKYKKFTLDAFGAKAFIEGKTKGTLTKSPKTCAKTLETGVFAGLTNKTLGEQYFETVVEG